MGGLEMTDLDMRGVEEAAVRLLRPGREGEEAMEGPVGHRLGREAPAASDEGNCA